MISPHQMCTIYSSCFFLHLNVLVYYVIHQFCPSSCAVYCCVSCPQAKQWRGKAPGVIAFLDDADNDLLRQPLPVHDLDAVTDMRKKHQVLCVDRLVKLIGIAFKVFPISSYFLNLAHSLKCFCCANLC